MRGFVYFAAILFFAAALAVSAQPKLEIIGGDTYNWGDVGPKDSPLKTKVQLKNTGNEKLNISDVHPACGCTTAPLDKDKLDPGETATIDITLNVAGRNGAITKSITISSNDPTKPQVVLYLKANIIREIIIEPTQYLTFNEMKVGKEATSQITIKNNSKETITFSDFEIKPDYMTVNVSKKIVLKPGEEFKLEAQVTPRKTGYFNCEVKMKSTHPDYSVIVIPGYGSVGESPIYNNNNNR